MLLAVNVNGTELDLFSDLDVRLGLIANIEIFGSHDHKRHRIGVTVLRQGHDRNRHLAGTVSGDQTMLIHVGDRFVARFKANELISRIAGQDCPGQLMRLGQIKLCDLVGDLDLFDRVQFLPDRHERAVALSTVDDLTILVLPTEELKPIPNGHGKRLAVFDRSGQIVLML